MEIDALIDKYAAGPEILRRSIVEMTPDQIDAAPVSGKWSTRQVVCHLADFVPINADRMKQIIAQDEPTFAGGFHQQFAEHLAYDHRIIELELQMIGAVRAHMATILRALPESVFARKGIHEVYGQMTLRTLLERAANHIPHHVAFIEEKKRALASAC